jgi:ABC-type multidrug transport system fused ATPase/permease subunit
MLVLVALSPFIGLYAFFEEHGRTISDLSHGIKGLGFAFGSLIRDLWRIFVRLVHAAGWITIVLLIASSILTLIYPALREIGISWPLLDTYYSITSRILENKVSWAAITVILGSMVAMTNLLNLEITKNKFIQEQKYRWREKYEDRLAKEKRHRGS